LKDWNTMPIFWRMAGTSVPFAGRSVSLKNILPPLGVSSRLRQRSKVLLPVPEGPMMEKLPFFDVGGDVFKHLQFAEAFTKVLRPDHACRLPALRFLLGSSLYPAQSRARARDHDTMKYRTATITRGKKALKVRLLIMSPALVRSCTAM